MTGNQHFTQKFRGGPYISFQVDFQEL